MQRRLPVSSPRLRAFAGESWLHFLPEQLWPLSCTEECVVLDIAGKSSGRCQHGQDAVEQPLQDDGHGSTHTTLPTVCRY